MTSKASTKEVAEQIAIHVMTSVADQELTGEEKLEKVCEFLVKLDDGIIGLNFIPNEIEAQLLETGIENVIEFLKEIDVKSFVQKNYNRIKNLLKRMFHKD